MDDGAIAARSPVAVFDVNRSYTNDGRLQRALMCPAPPSTAVNSVPELQQIITNAAKKTTVSALQQAKNWQYRKERIIGAGADGKVYLATDLSTREHIAVKEILISTATNRTLKQAQEDSKKMGMMKKQIDALRKLPQHQNVVQHLGAERTTCALNVMMEFVAGGSISALLSKLGPFSEKVIRVYTRHICTALAFLHESGVIHRDIKGANCLVGLDGTAKVADFGCCIIHSLTAAAAGSAGADHVEKPGIHGTSMWMSPECIQALPVSDKTDMWSLGCTIVEMATGRPPWAEAHFTNEWAAMFYISQAKRGPPIPPHLSRQAHHFLQRCFCVDPSQRLSAAECLEHPFLSQEYDPESEDREMHPPTPTEPQHNFPRAPTSATTTTDDASSTDDYATSNYSTITGGVAVYDQEWGDAEVNDDDMERFVDPTERQAQQQDRELGQQQQPQQQQQQRGERQPSSPDLNGSLSDARHSAVSQEAIDTYIRCAGSPTALKSHVLKAEDSTALALAEDEHGFGLSEPVLYAVFAYLDHTSLCHLEAVSHSIREMVSTGAKEFLWRNLFLQQFGEVDKVRMTLRKSWKTYFQVSLYHQAMQLEDVEVVRQLCQSLNVFEGRDRKSHEPVVIKLERWSNHQPGGKKQSIHEKSGVSQFTATMLNATMLQQRDMSPMRQSETRDRSSIGTAGSSAGMSPMSRTPSKPLKVNPFGAGSGSNAGPNLSRQQPASLGGTFVSSGAALPSQPPLSPPKRSAAVAAESGPHHPPSTPKHQQFSPQAVGGKPPMCSPKKSVPILPAQPQSAPTHVGNPLLSTVQRGKILPRTKGQNTPSAVSRVLAMHHTPEHFPATSSSSASPSTNENGKHQFVFLQPSQFMKELHASSSTTSASTTPSKGDASSSCPSSATQGLSNSDVTSMLNGTMTRDQFGRTLLWSHDLYDFPRSSDLVPLSATSKPVQRSLLQHHYKILRHLEALGTRCIPRLLHYKDADANLACNVLVTSPVGPSLNELLSFCGNQLTLRTVCLLALRLLDAAEELHIRDVVHAAITPTNVAVGVGEQTSHVFLLNFAQGRFFRDPRTHRPIATFTTSATAEKARKQNEYLSFCSTFIQKNCTAAPRDDIIAIGYVLCYLFYGGLPWIKERQQLNNTEVVRQKMLYMDALQRAPPIQLHYFLKSGYALRQGELPDYSYLRGLIRRLMIDKGWSDDGAFDWTTQLNDITPSNTAEKTDKSFGTESSVLAPGGVVAVDDETRDARIRDDVREM